MTELYVNDVWITVIPLWNLLSSIVYWLQTYVNMEN